MDRDPPTPTITIPDSILGRDNPSAEPALPYLFLVLAAHQPLLEPSRHGLADLDRIVIGRGKVDAPRIHLEGERHLRINVPDSRMSSTHAQLVRTLDRWTIEDLSSTNGTVLNGRRVRGAILADHDLVECGQTFFLFRAALATPTDEEGATKTPASDHTVLSTLLPSLARAFSRLAQVAASQVSVVILGETGTGKELIARAVHDISDREGQFTGINCGALPPTLLEAELFGYEKGAFSGADKAHTGHIRSAHKGTLLLDEIGDLPLGSQTAFLRILEERQVMPVGGKKPVPVDLRLCSATHRQLETLVAENKFRADLLTRISGFTIHLPPLRDRRMDIGLILGNLLRRIAGERAEQLSLTREAARALLSYRWPGNVREFLKCLEPAVILAEDGRIHLDDLPPVLLASLEESSTTSSVSGLTNPQAFESDKDRCPQLEALLQKHEGNISAIARETGRDRALIRRWLKQCGLNPEDFRKK